MFVLFEQEQLGKDSILQLAGLSILMQTSNRHTVKLRGLFILSFGVRASKVWVESDVSYESYVLYGVIMKMKSLNSLPVYYKLTGANYENNTVDNYEFKKKK